jgi:hypothetical protein
LARRSEGHRSGKEEKTKGGKEMRVVYDGKTLEVVELTQLCDKYREALEEIIEYGTTGEDAKLMYEAAKEALV